MSNEPSLEPASNMRLAVKNSLAGLLAVAAQILGNSLAFLVIAHIPGLSVESFGALTYAFALAQLFAVLFEYGLGPYVAREVAAIRAHDIGFENAAYGLHLVLMIFGMAIFVCALQFLDFSASARETCLWVGASVFITTTFRFFFAFYQAREKIFLETSATIVEVFVLSTVIALAFITTANVVAIARYFFIARLFTWLVGYLLMAKSVRWMLPSFSAKLWKHLLIKAAPFGFTFVIALAIVSIDTIMLRQLVPTDPEYQIGLYQAVMRLILMPTVVGLVATKVFLPQFSRLDMQRGGNIMSEIRNLNNLLLTFGLLCGTAFHVRAESIIVLAFGKSFLEAGNLLSIMAFTLMMRFGAAYNLYFSIKSKMWLRVSFALISLISTIILNYIYIPKYGAVGSAYASIISHVIYWIPFLLCAKYYEDDMLLGWKWQISLPMSLILYLFLKLTSNISIFIVIPLFVIYALFCGYLILEKKYKRSLLLSLKSKNYE